MCYQCACCGELTEGTIQTRLPYFGIEDPEREVPMLVSLCCGEPVLKDGKLYTYEDLQADKKNEEFRV